MSYKGEKKKASSFIFSLNHTYFSILLPRTCRTEGQGEFSWAGKLVAAVCDKERTSENSDFGLKDFFFFNIDVKKT